MKNFNNNGKPETKEFFVEGMHCTSCELYVEKRLKKSKLVENVDINLTTQKVSFKTNLDISEDLLIKKLNKLIEEGGYKITNQAINQINNKINWKDLGKAFGISIVIMIGFLAVQRLGIADILSDSGELTLPMVFLIGIVASLSSCMAVVGGLVLSISASFSKSGKNKSLVLFHIARIVGFFILGELIGFIGSAFSINQNVYFVISILLFIVMIILGINLLDVFPLFRKFQLRLPKFLTFKALDQDTITNKFAPIFIGVITFFLPCGFTQSMQFNAIASGNILKGSLIMGVFALGTFPMLALVSFTSTRLSGRMNSKLFFQVTGFIALFFAILNFWSSLTFMGIVQSPF